MPYKDKAKQRKAQAEAQSRKRNRVREYIRDQKDNKPCMDCDQVFRYYVLQHDHRDPSGKVDSINRLARGANMTAVKAEIEKCDLVCANCHAERTQQVKTKRLIY